MGTTICEKKRSLLETYQNATQSYADGVEKLRRQMGTIDKPDMTRYIA